MSETKPIHFLGRFRGNITNETVLLDCRVLRLLYKRGPHTEADLFNHLATVPRELLRASTSRLSEWGVVEVVPPVYGRVEKFALTSVGQHWGLELVCARRVAESDAANSKVPVVLED
jgi:hypothetical protein